MTEQEQKAFDQMRAALQIADNIALTGAAYTPKSIETGLSKIREALTAANAVQQAQGAVPWKCVDGSACKHGWWCSESYCQEHCVFRSTSTKGTP